MARLNSRGQALWGIAGGAGNVRILLTLDGSGNAIDIGTEIGLAIASRLGLPPSGWEGGSGAIWIDDDSLLVQFCGDTNSPSGCSLWKWHLLSKTLTGPIGQGANNLKGRGGTWLAHLIGPAPGYSATEQWLGVFASNGFHSRHGAMGDVFSNGDFLLIKDYQQQTLGMELRSGGSGALLRDIPTTGQIGGVFARGNVALWFDFGSRQLTALNAPNPVQIPNVTDHTGPFAADVQGRLWICDGQNGLLLRAWDAHVGYWISRDEFSFWQDCISLPNGRIRIVASMNQGETPAGVQRVWDVDPLTGAFTFNGTPGQATLVSTETGEPATLPAAPARPIVTNNAAANGFANAEDTGEILLLVAGLALAWYLLDN